MKNVLFVCLGNSCRSQMAEGFARVYGKDVMTASSAGLAPASIIQPLTHSVMEEKGIRLDTQFPKTLTEVSRGGFDVVVNMSGYDVSWPNAMLRTWKVDDPIGQTEAKYRKVRDQIERLVMELVLEFRRVAAQDTVKAK